VKRSKDAIDAILCLSDENKDGQAGVADPRVAAKHARTHTHARIHNRMQTHAHSGREREQALDGRELARGRMNGNLTEKWIREGWKDSGKVEGKVTEDNDERLQVFHG
jgi:hypothetical protein